jgi:hypothetical protein
MLPASGGCCTVADPGDLLGDWAWFVAFCVSEAESQLDSFAEYNRCIALAPSFSEIDDEFCS